MQYEKVLRLALVPAIVFLLLSLVSVALTVHYWISGDWRLPKGVRVTTNDFDDRTQTYRTDYTIVYYIDRETNVTIASGCLCLSAAVMALIAWATLRKPDMDTQLAAGKRRFWVLSVVVMTAASAGTALASLVLHYTEKGNDLFGCDSETLMMSGKLNTNKYCTREMGACNFLPKYTLGSDREYVSVACNETVIVKWLQLILLFNATVVFAMFAVQARVRRTTRSSRELGPLSKVS